MLCTFSLQHNLQRKNNCIDIPCAGNGYSYGVFMYANQPDRDELANIACDRAHVKYCAVRKAVKEAR